MVLTAHMGVAFSTGLSKNSTWAAPDAVVPVTKVCVNIARDVRFTDTNDSR
jgi:hypothetical protein